MSGRGARGCGAARSFRLLPPNPFPKCTVSSSDTSIVVNVLIANVQVSHKLMPRNSASLQRRDNAKQWIGKMPFE